MPKFIKNPVVVDAIEYTGENLEEVVAFGRGKVASAGGNLIGVSTNEGHLLGKPGCFVVRAFTEGIGEHVWPCDGVYFRLNYEEIKE